MTIEEILASRLKEAMRAKDSQALGALRMVKTAGQAAMAAPGFNGETGDAFWTDIIGKYVKQQIKARAEFEKAGEDGRAQVEGLTFEIEYFQEFLPKMKGPDEVRVFVKRAIEQMGKVDVKMVGRIVGAVMKEHKGEVDPGMVKEIATQELS